MPSTTNFGWTTPADTDLVKDGAAAIRTLGNGIDTSFVDLKGGTTGQVLAKASNTDLDFTWQADASGIPATIIDAKGDLIAGSAADTASRLAVGTNNQQLLADSSTATGLKWGASSTSTLTATGDILYASAANTLARRAIGSSGQVLTVSSGVPAWTTITTGFDGVYTSWTPTLSQAGTSRTGFTAAAYAQVGEFVHIHGQVNVNATGTADSEIQIDLPVTADSANYGNIVLGTVFQYDSSAGNYNVGVARLNNSTSFWLWGGVDQTQAWGRTNSSNPGAVGSGDEFYFNILVRT